MHDNLAGLAHVLHFDIGRATELWRQGFGGIDDPKVDPLLVRHANAVPILFGFLESSVDSGTLLEAGMAGGMGEPDVDMDILVADVTLDVSWCRRCPCNSRGRQRQLDVCGGLNCGTVLRRAPVSVVLLPVDEVQCTDIAPRRRFYRS